MGGGTEIVKDAQVIGLSKKFGAFKKKVLLENGKTIAQGMNSVISARSRSIVEIKSLYNKKYLEAMGYAPNDNILIDKISEGKVLEYTKNYIDSQATYVSNPLVNTLGTLDQAILELQDKPNFKRSEMSFTHSDDKKYYYFTSVQNGSNIDISCYLNDEDTVTPYLENKYPDGYAILEMNTYPLVDDGSVYWKAEVEYIYYEEVEEEVEGELVLVTYQKLGLVTEYIDCTFIYFTVLDEEEAQMYALAQQHSGPFTTTGTYIIEGDSDNRDETITVTVTGTFTVTYIGNGEFSYTMDAPYPYGQTKYQNSAWDNGVSSYQAQKVSILAQATISVFRKLIWDYGRDREDIDSARRTYVSGDLLNSFIVKEQADAYPIIPLKRWLNFVNSSKMDIVLKKIGIEGKDFHDSLKQPEIWDAYLFFGIPFSSSNPGLIQYVFEFFTTLSNVRENYSKYSQLFGANSLNISFDGMGIHQNYYVESWVVVEPATRPVGTYWFQKTSITNITGYEEKWVSNGDEGGEMVTAPITETHTYGEYYYQESESYHIKIRPTVTQYWYILGGVQWGNVGGRRRRRSENYEEDSWGGVAGGANDKIELRLPILKQITNKMDFNLLCDVIEQSMSLAIFTAQEVKTKWYQTGFFQFVMIVVMVALAIVTAGAATAFYASIGYSMLGYVVAGAIVLSTAMSIATMLTGADFGWFGAVVGAVAIIGGGAAAIMNSGTTVVKAVLLTANMVLQVVSQVNDLMFRMEFEKKQDQYNNTLDRQEEELDKLSEEYEELHQNNGMIVNMFNNMKSLDDIDLYYNIATANFDSNYLMFDYATDYDKFYKTK